MKLIDLYSGRDYSIIIEKKNALEERIANKLHINPSQIRLTNGSNGAIEYITLKLAEIAYRQHAPNKNAIIDVPNYFDTLQFIKSAGFKTIAVPRKDGFEFPYFSFKRFLKKDPYLTIITDPNNPCGTTLLAEELESLISEANNSTILIDRTCITTKEHISTSNLLKKYSSKRLVILHSYSKTHSLSGKRIGYMAASNVELSKQLFEYVDDGRVSIDAMNALESCIDDSDIINQNKLKINKSKKVIDSFKEQYEWFKHSNTSSNFVTIYIPKIIASELSSRFKFPQINEQFGIAKENYYRINISEPAPIKEFFKQYAELNGDT